METTFRTQLVHAARGLFLSKGYESVGMREIAQAVGKAPTQVYRLGLSKTDILAEIIIELNQEQIDRLPGLLMTLTGANAFERTCAYLLRLYESDIEYMPVRAIGAAQGWTWSTAYEEAVTAQVWELLAPIVGWLADDHVGDIPARCRAIWSLYYVGYRPRRVARRHCGRLPGRHSAQSGRADTPASAAIRPFAQPRSCGVASRQSVQSSPMRLHRTFTLRWLLLTVGVVSAAAAWLWHDHEGTTELGSPAAAEREQAAGDAHHARHSQCQWCAGSGY
jgi:AcrR family transcriptional regulator